MKVMYSHFKKYGYFFRRRTKNVVDFIEEIDCIAKKL